MTLNGAQQQTPGESGQLQDPKGGEGNKPQDPNTGSTEPQDPGKGEGNAPQDPKPGEGDPQEPKVDHKLEADNRRLLSNQHSIVYVESQKILHHPTQDAKMHNKKGKRHKVVCPAR